MTRHTLFLEDRHLTQLRSLGKTRGLKHSQLIRLAIAEFIRREAARDARAKSAQGE
jgi:hypothetical protein